MLKIIKKIIPAKIKTGLRNILLSGSNVECPICEKTFVKFLPFGLPPAQLRPNAMCPNCNSLERTRIYWKFLTSDDDFFTSNKTVLHVAPESKLFQKFSTSPFINYFPIDKFTEGYKYPKGTIDMDITKMEYPNDKFDFILCSHVLEHIPHDILAMSELYRVMKPGGWGILQVPIEMDRKHTYEDISITSPKERQEAFGQFDHVRIYGKDYIERLKSVGFKVELNEFAKNLSADEMFRFGFGDGEDLFVVKKPLTICKRH